MASSSARSPSQHPRLVGRALACAALVIPVAACWRGAAGPTGEPLGRGSSPPPSARRAPPASPGCVAVVTRPGGRSPRGATCQPGESIEIRFVAPVASTASRRAWVTVTAASSPPSAYDEWTYLDDGAAEARLPAPTRPGDYEVRLHTNYPAQSFNVIGMARVVVAPPRRAGRSATPPALQRFGLAAMTLAPGSTVVMRFPAPLRAGPGEQFWVTVVPDGAPDSDWAAWAYVTDGTRGAALPAPDQPGSYEVRLHANYPTRTTNVVCRAPLLVQ